MSYQSSESELEEVDLVGGSASPFIDEGDGFTGERVRMFLSFVAHANEDWIMVGAHNTVDFTVECQVHVGGCVSSSGRVDIGTCKILLAQRHGRSLTMFTGYGESRRLQHY